MFLKFSVQFKIIQRLFRSYSKLFRSYPEAIQKLFRSYPEAVQKLFRSYSEAIPRRLVKIGAQDPSVRTLLTVEHDFLKFGNV